jgi:hypothetical protein
MEDNRVKWHKARPLPKFSAIEAFQEEFIMGVPKRLSRVGRWKVDIPGLNSTEITVQPQGRLRKMLEHISYVEGMYVQDIAELQNRVDEALKVIPAEDDSPEIVDWG